MNELEHALCEFYFPIKLRKWSDEMTAATLSDEPDSILNLMPEDAATRTRGSTMSIFSFAESFSDTRYNPYDISRYIDRVSLMC